MSDERDDLESLLKHPGFLRLRAYQQKYWTDEIGRLTGLAVNDDSDVKALSKLRQMVAAQTATARLLGWPEERLGQLGRAHPKPLDMKEDATTWPTRRGSL